MAMEDKTWEVPSLRKSMTYITKAKLQCSVGTTPGFDGSEYELPLKSSNRTLRRLVGEKEEKLSNVKNSSRSFLGTAKIRDSFDFEYCHHLQKIFDKKV
uniref:Uncharacterized protein n=1 Tax=Romanomermis culicivorax TaxID=13658 RepID=A0A915I0D3_ROMCU